jgi:hypothetical protein
MDYFRADNTEGYSTEDLALLNAAWASLGISVFDEEEDAVLSVQDHVAAELLFHFDRGLRGAALVCAAEG